MLSKRDGCCKKDTVRCFKELKTKRTSVKKVQPEGRSTWMREKGEWRLWSRSWKKGFRNLLLRWSVSRNYPNGPGQQLRYARGTTHKIEVPIGLLLDRFWEKRCSLRGVRGRTGSQSRMSRIRARMSWSRHMASRKGKSYHRSSQCPWTSRAWWSTRTFSTSSASQLLEKRVKVDLCTANRPMLLRKRYLQNKKTKRHPSLKSKNLLK